MPEIRDLEYVRRFVPAGEELNDDGTWTDRFGKVHVPWLPEHRPGPPMPVLWVDLETTGLEARKDAAICEVAVVLTDAELRIIETWQRVVHVPEEVEWEPVALGMHKESGLWAMCKHPSATELDDVEEALMKVLRRHFAPDVRLRPGGSSVQFDRGWLEKKMPRVASVLHPYRNVDVSTLKELAAVWHPGLHSSWEQLKGRPHRALPDILMTLAELRFYRQPNGFIAAPLPD